MTIPLDPSNFYVVDDPKKAPMVFPTASSTRAGMMSGADKAKLDGITPGGGGATNAGVASFASGGAGAGFDFVTIVFVTPMNNVGYVINLTPAVADATLLSPPQVFYDTANKTINGMRIFPQAQFVGEVSWAVFNKTQ